MKTTNENEITLVSNNLNRKGVLLKDRTYIEVGPDFTLCEATLFVDVVFYSDEEGGPETELLGCIPSGATKEAAEYVASRSAAYIEQAATYAMEASL